MVNTTPVQYTIFPTYTAPVAPTLTLLLLLRLPATTPTGHVNKFNTLINKCKNNKRHGQVIGSELRGAAVKGMAVRSTGGLAGSRRVVCGAAVTN